jgi:hypothetical protein
VVGVAAALDHAGLFELAQPGGEDVARGPGASGDALEAGLPVAQLAGYQQGVAVADDRERVGDGTHPAAWFAFWTHRVSVPRTVSCRSNSLRRRKETQ